MLFSVKKQVLQQPLALVAGVVESAGDRPILGTLLVELAGDTLTLTGTNLEVQIQVRVPLSDAPSGKAEEFTLPAKECVRALKLLPEDSTVDFEISAGKATVKSNKSKYEFATLPAEKDLFFKPIEPVTEFKKPCSKLLPLLQKTSFAMAQQDPRYYLNSLLLEMTSEHLRTVATDGHRLAISTLPEPVFQSEKDKKTSVIIPRRAVVELTRLLEGEAEATISLTEDMLQVDTGTRSLTTKLIDGRYPDYEKVIPQNTDKVLSCDRIHLLNACRRAAVISDDRGGSVQFHVSEPGELSIEANSGSAGPSHTAKILFDGKYNGAEVEIAFKYSYLQDIMNTLEGAEIRLSFQDGNSSALIQDPGQGDTSYVVMPLRL